MEFGRRRQGGGGGGEMGTQGSMLDEETGTTGRPIHEKIGTMAIAKSVKPDQEM